MYSRLVSSALAAGGILLGTVALAQEPDKLPPPKEEKVVPPAAEAPAGTPGEGCPVPMVEQSFDVKKIHIVEDQALIAIPRMPVREEITKIPFVGLDIEYKEEKRTVCFMMPKPRLEERQVNSVSLIPETTIDPCTGCPCTTYKEVPVCKTVKVEVMDIVPVTREYVVLVPVVKPANKLAVVRRVVMDQITVPAMATTCRAVESSATITAPKPACEAPITIPERPCGH